MFNRKSYKEKKRKCLRKKEGEGKSLESIVIKISEKQRLLIRKRDEKTIVVSLAKPINNEHYMADRLWFIDIEK